MKKIILILVWIIAVVLPLITSLVISILNNTIPQWDIAVYLLKGLSVVRNNMGYYGTIFGIFIAIETFLDNKKQREEQKEQGRQDFIRRQEEREKELIRIQEESNLIREKEIESKKDNYRPIFIIDDNVELLMRKEELFLENIIYSTWNKDKMKNEVKKIGTKRSGECIVKGTCENPVPDNFYITGETILGEKILFGFLFGEYKIYKYLNEYGNPLFPRESNLEKYDYYKIKENWTSYNVVSSINSFEESLDESVEDKNMLFNNLEKIFFYNSQDLREYLCFNKVESIRNIINSSTHEELYNKLFTDLTNGYSKSKYFTDNSIIEVINTVYTQVYYNADLFKMSNIKIHEEYVIEKIQVIEEDVELKDKKELFEVTEELKKYFQSQNFENMRLILDCIMKIVGYAKNLPNESNEKYKVLECCLKVLKVAFENIEEEKENNILLQSKFLFDKSEILSKIEFEEE